MVKGVCKLLVAVSLVMVLCIPKASAQEYVGGVLTENTVFSPAFNPYIALESIIVPAGITLTIEAGTNVSFMVNTSIIIEGGELIARGELDLPVRFDTQRGDKWNGIIFNTSRTEINENGEYLSGSILEYISVNETSTGLALTDSAFVYARNINITNCSYGIQLETGSTLQLLNSVIDHCDYGMYIKNSGSNIVDSCSVTNCSIGIYFAYGITSRYNRITNNDLSYNETIALFMSIGQSNLQYNLIHGNTVSHNDIGLHIGNLGTDDKGFNVISMNIVRQNNIGIKLSQDADTLKFNQIEQNNTGILLARASSNELFNNLIQDNVEWGLTLTDGSNRNLISANTLIENGNGIKVTHKEFKYSIGNSFIYNSLNRNTNEAFLFEAGPQEPLVFNTILADHDTGVFVNHFVNDVVAINNWWGTSDTTSIDSMIYDIHDLNTYGEVIYKPFLDFPDPDSPISKPKLVFKRLIDNKVKVDWIKNTEPDLAGYKIYYGNENENGFIGSFDVGIDTTYILENISLFDRVAVTAYDDDADGLADQFEGHESVYCYAIAGPYAGADSVICGGEVFMTTTATSLGDQNLLWSTSGDGSFDNSAMLTTSYTPGQNDIAAGSVMLTLSLSAFGIEITDQMELSINGIPFVFAGNDTTVNQHDAHRTVTANAGNYSMIEWVTTGDGSFVNANALITDYQPGVNDIASGAVKLILKLQSECGNLNDTLLLVVIPSYNISGKIRKGDIPVSNGVIIAIRNNASGSKAVSSEYSLPDGTFNFINLATGSYYLYALSDPQTDKMWLPTYYAESFKWQTAYLLPINTDIFDVDINLLQKVNQLPDGVGLISGFFNYVGKSGEDDSLYNTPWFPSNYYQSGSDLSLPASNHVVLLMNTDLTRIFAWALTASDGSFHFENLPYGNYRLWGEKAGYSNSLSPVISLSPSNSEVEEIQLTINQKTIEISLPANESMDQNFDLYPNPATDWLWYKGNGSESGSYEITFFDIYGRSIKQSTFNNYPGSATGSINISDLRSGIYICHITSDSGITFVGKITVAR